MAVVVGVVVVGVVVGVVDSSSIATTSTLEIERSPDIVIPVFVIAVAIDRSVVRGTSLYAWPINSPATQVNVMLVISSRRMIPVLAMAVAMASRVRSSSPAVNPHEPTPKLARIFCSLNSARSRGHTAVVPI